MSRKVMKTTTGQRRRSPRISALDSSKDDHQSSTRTCRAKRSLDNAAALPPLSKLAKQVWKGRDSQENADCVEWRSLKENQKGVATNGKASVMPTKHILELVLDTLQRRDTYEIFAQPVDPDEVEDYYEIIKEPMDFGTMRAKLHEGMYQDLQQFETKSLIDPFLHLQGVRKLHLWSHRTRHDVFLIPENAMHFNSSGTTYFRQARAIHDLANKVLHALKTKPESFVSEFSGTRRRSMRKALSENKDAVETLQCPSTSTLRRSNRKSPPKRNFLSGDRLFDSQEADSRRDTYLCKNEDLVHSTFLTSCKPLALMNEGDISYKESLMWYVKDLGPTALLVAKRKLLGQHESTTTAKDFKTFRDFAPPAGSSRSPFAKAIDLHGEAAKTTRGRRKEKLINSSPRPVILALESHHHSNVGDQFKPRNKKSCIVFDEDVQKKKKEKEKEKEKEKKALPLPLVSHFTFDLPFLKARLDQMKAATK